MDHWVGRVAVYFIRVQGELGGRVFVLVRYGYQVWHWETRHMLLCILVFIHTCVGEAPKAPFGRTLCVRPQRWRFWMLLYKAANGHSHAGMGKCLQYGPSVSRWKWRRYHRSLIFSAIGWSAHIGFRKGLGYTFHGRSVCKL
jgi:hypothetical protein